MAADFNGDGKPDLAVACYNYADVGVLLGNGDGTFQAGQAYSVGGDPYGLTAGDFNGDGIIDLATANYSSSTVAILLGNAAKLLPVDATTGLASGYGRGNLSSSSDVDYFSWTGKAGDVVQVASQDPNGDYDYFEIVNANGSGLVSFGGPNSQSTPYTLPYSGTYFVEVYSGTTGEYRFRVTESPPTLPLVTTYDGSISGSNAPTLVNSSPGNLTATLAGYIGQGDPNGEYFKLGNVVAGTQINLSLTQPTSSLLGGVLNVYNSAGTNLTNNLIAGNSFSYTVPAGAGGTYYARVSSASTTTVSFWMDWNGTSNEFPISFGGYGLWLYSGSFGFSNGESDIYGIASTNLANAWHLVTATFVDGNDTKGQLYIDGVLQTLSQRYGTSGSDPLVSTGVTIGSYNGSSYNFTGSLDEVAFFDGTLTAAQVQAEYAARTSGSAYSSVVLSQNPVAYYRLGESAGGTVAYDSSGKYDNASYSTGITPGVAGYPTGDTAYQFTSGAVSAVITQSTGLFAQYVISLDVANTTPPLITADTLPVQGTTTSSIVDRFTLNFSEDLNPTTVNNVANYVLKDASGNTYHVTSPGYTAGTTASYLVSDGPLQPGTYTLTISNLADRTSNVLVPYTLSFTVVNVAPYVFESRSDNTAGTATPLVTPTSQPDGSFSLASNLTVGTNPYAIASAALRGVGHRARPGGRQLRQQHHLGALG